MRVIEYAKPFLQDNKALGCPPLISPTKPADICPFLHYIKRKKLLRRHKASPASIRVSFFHFKSLIFCENARGAVLAKEKQRPLFFRLIVPGDAFQQVGLDLVQVNADLRHAVALADGNGLVVQRLEVDGDAERRTYLVLATIAPPDVGDVVVLRHHNALQLLVEALRRLKQFRLVLL